MTATGSLLQQERYPTLERAISSQFARKVCVNLKKDFIIGITEGAICQGIHGRGRFQAQVSSCTADIKWPWRRAREFTKSYVRSYVSPVGISRPRSLTIRCPNLGSSFPCPAFAKSMGAR